MLVALLCAALAGCNFGAGGGGTEKEKISVPVVSIDKDGYATWEAVENAMYYVYVIDGGEEQINMGDGVQLSEGQTIRVKAVSADGGKDDSDFSAPQTYRRGDIAELSFYAVNDLHGKFMDTENQPGLDEFTTYVKDLYEDPAREEILLSSGDMWQGTVESSSNKGKLMTEWMNDAGFVSMTLGNHEFDWGTAVLDPNSELADFSFLGINITYNGVMPDYCKASAVVERGGVKIGIIGAIGDCLSSISGEFRAGLSFATGSRLTDLVRNEAVRLRNEENCDFIVYSIHDGGSGFSSSGVNSVKNSDMEWYDTALSDGYVDLVFEGHTHQRYILRDEYGVYHMQAASENKYLSCADVTFNKATKEFTVKPQLISSRTYADSGIGDDPIVKELYGEYFPDGDPYAVIGSNRTKRNSETIEQKVAELYLQAGKEEWGEYGIVAGGGYLNARDPYSVAAGGVSYADLFSVLPFDNDIVLGSIGGSDLITFLNRQSDDRNPYHICAEISVSQIEPGKTYYIVVDTYTSSYSSNHITEIGRYKGGGVYARDLLADFVRGGGWA